MQGTDKKQSALWIGTAWVAVAVLIVASLTLLMGASPTIEAASIIALATVIAVSALAPILFGTVLILSLAGHASYVAAWKRLVMASARHPYTRYGFALGALKAAGKLLAAAALAHTGNMGLVAALVVTNFAAGSVNARLESDSLLRTGGGN